VDAADRCLYIVDTFLDVKCEFAEKLADS